ncbi:MAG: chromosome segregation ATPase [Oceanicoccus sp.]
MAAAEQLEALIKLELDLKSQYEKKMTAERYKIDALNETQTKLQATISQQAADINTLTKGGGDVKRLEQENREISNRADNIKNEFDAQRNKVKAAQKELISLKSEVKELKQFDAKKLKKNLVETKKKLEEQRKANELFSKSNRELKQESFEQKNSIEQLEKELEELKPKDAKVESEVETEEAAVA